MEESTSREKILKKVRNALMNKPAKESIANIDFESEVFYKADDEPELIFAQNFTEAGGKFIFCEDNAVLIDNLDFVVKESGWTSGLACEEGIIQELLNIAEVTFSDKYTDETPIVVCSCENLIARTGSIMVSSRQGTSKTAFLDAKILVVVAFTNQLVSDMKEALNQVKKKYNGSFPNMISVITNPIYQDSENQQPQELYVLLIESEDEI
jgi:L-lactate dehydrogenase complex protein LldG